MEEEEESWEEAAESATGRKENFQIREFFFKFKESYHHKSKIGKRKERTKAKTKDEVLKWQFKVPDLSLPESLFW